MTGYHCLNSLKKETTCGWLNQLFINTRSFSVFLSFQFRVEATYVVSSLNFLVMGLIIRTKLSQFIPLRQTLETRETLQHAQNIINDMF